ncbi:MAG: hypothetical protein AAGI28_17080 [Pseudomonadota bacterium]
MSFEQEYIVRIRTDPETGSRLGEEWRLNSSEQLLHREDGPALQEWSPKSGIKVRECYLLHGEYDKNGGPSKTERDPNTGTITLEEWRKCGALYREGGKPAYIEIDPETGVVVIEGYYEGGVEHRLNGPAVIVRDRESGRIISESYYVNGDMFEPPGGDDALDATPN